MKNKATRKVVMGLGDGGVLHGKWETLILLNYKIGNGVMEENKGNKVIELGK